MLTKNTILTTEMLHLEMQKLNSEQSLLFFKIRHACLVLSIIVLAEDPESDWTEEDMLRFEQIKHSLSFLLQSEKIDCKINYSKNFAAVLQNNSTKIRYAICPILANNLERLSKIQTEKVFKDIQHCSNVLNEYTSLLDALGVVFHLNEDDENIQIQRVFTTFEQARNHICRQLWYVSDELCKLIKASSKDLSPVLVAWIMQVCLTEHEEVLRYEMGSWLYEHLMVSCGDLLTILPEPNLEKLSYDEQKMLLESIKSHEMQDEMDEEDDDDDDDNNSKYQNDDLPF